MAHSSAPRLDFARPLLAFGAVLVCLVLGQPRRLAAAGPSVAVTRVDVASQGAGKPPRVTAHVTVADLTGVPVAGLTPDSFQLTVDGQPVTSVSLASGTNTADTLAVAMALDLSGSMAPALANLRDAGNTFVNALQPQDQVAVLTFQGTSVTTRTGLTNDRNRIQTVFNNLQAFGDTPLWDAVASAVRTAKDQPAGRRAVLVMTDGEDTDSKISFDTAVNVARDNGVPVFVVGLGNDVGRDQLQLLADTTGGTFTPVPTSSQLANSFKNIAQSLRVEYTLSYDGEPLNHDTDHELLVTANVRGQSGQGSKRYSVQAVISQHVTPTLTAPNAGVTTSKDLELAAAVTPEVSVQNVEFLADGKLFATKTVPPFTATWPTKGVTTGQHTLAVRATGIDGKVETAQVAVTYIDPHVTLSLASPRDGDHLTKNVDISANPSPVPSVKSVRFFVDDAQVQELTAPPFTYSWDVKRATLGGHVIRVEATGADSQTDKQEIKVVVTTAGGGNGPVVAAVTLFLLMLLVVVAALLFARSRRRALAVATAGSAGGAGLRARVAEARRGATEAPPAGWLQEIRPDGSTASHPLQPGETLIGREQEFPNVNIEDPDASRMHARITFQGGAPVFEDLGPTNPTRINGYVYAGPHALQDGDELSIGGTRLVYRATGTA